MTSAVVDPRIGAVDARWMTTDGIARLRDVVPGPAIVEDLERIDATRAPFGGHFLVHGDRRRVVDGAFEAVLVIIGFPDRATAGDWYASPAYREILPLRTENSRGDVLIVDGVEADRRAADVGPLLQRVQAMGDVGGSASRAAAT
jgi:uncharacterized protein (DUF1330 family)